MEAPENLHGSCGGGEAPQFAMDKQGGKPGEASFLVEDLLDFPNDEEGLWGGGDGLGFDTPPDDSTLTAVDSSSNSACSGGDPRFPGDLGCGLSDGLSVPYDEIAELEWLSNFVEESFSSEDLQRLQLISGACQSSPGSRGAAEGPGGAPAAAVLPPETHVPGKARSKRSRPAPSSWSSRLLVLSPTTSSSDSDAAVPPPVTSGAPAPAPKVPKPAKKKPDAADGGPPSAAPDGRKCLHCTTDKTPQWRTGPMGPKTLCNACGVRYKSGRLVPEYRPAASPTFVPSKHSNSHRKVLELRRQKELQPPPPQPHGVAAAAAAPYASQFLSPAAGGFFDPPVAGGAGDDLLVHHHLGPDFRQLI